MKKIKHFERVTLLSFLFMAVGTLMLVNGCSKMNTRENTTLAESELSETARNYMSGLADKEKEMTTQPSAEQPVKGIKNRVTPFTKMNALMMWDKATAQQQGDLNYVLVPLKEALKPFANKGYEFFRNVIFYKDKDGKSNMTIVEVLSKKDESLGNDLQQIAITAFENKYFSKSQPIGALNASVFFFNEAYKQVASFQLQNGQWAPVRMSFRSDLDITQ